MAPDDDRHLAAFGFNFRQQRCLLLRRPLPTPFNPRHDLNNCQSCLLLELQKELQRAEASDIPAATSIRG